MERPPLALLARMIASLLLLITLSSGQLIHASSSASPLCTGSRAPVVLGESALSFCGYSGISCCDAVDDAALREQFEAINVSNAACAAVVKTILCAECSPSSAELFDAAGSTTKTRPIPLLCSSTPSSSFSHHPHPDDDNYCQLVWQTCMDAAMANSRRFQPHRPLQAARTNDATRPRSSPSSTKTKLTDFWRSETDFCSSFGSSSSSRACFNGKGVSLQSHGTTRSLQFWRPSPQVMCVERIGAGSYLAMAAHPDGSGRVFLSSQDSKIWLASVPEHGSGGTLDLEPGPFLDISDRVHFDARLGLMVMGVAFHPEFATNGRFFVSYTCDSARSPTCGAGRCELPAKLGAAAGGARPCRYQLVVSEFSVKRGVSKAMTAGDPSEVRRIFTMGLPYASHNHGGQILFRPTDEYLYLITGHGGQKADHFDVSQDKRSFLGKIIRLDINHTPGQSEVSNRSKPEIFAVGLSNPRGCSFDSMMPSYFYCGDVAKGLYEEVHLISEGGNYGGSPVKADSPIISHGRPAAGMPPSIVGGLVYRGSMDPSLEGRYLYTYGSVMWAGMETPEGSGRYASTRIPLASCSRSPPMPCRGGAIPGSILSFGEDNRKDAFVLATGGVYRVVRPGLCGGARPTGKPAVAGATVGSTNGGLLPAEPSPSGNTWLWLFGPFGVIALFLACRNYLKEITNGNAQAAPNSISCSCCNTITCFGTSNYY